MVPAAPIATERWSRTVRAERRLVAVLALLAVAGLARPANAAPLVLGYSGRLYDAAATPLAGSHDIDLRIYATPVAGAPLFVESHPAVEVIDGYFALLINALQDDPSFDLIFAGHDELYLELGIDGETLSPRQALASVPWALSSSTDRLDTLAGLACLAGQVAKWDGSSWACADDATGAAGLGDITSVLAGLGLLGGADAGAAELAVDFAGSGSATSVARSDHDHDPRYYTQSQADALLADKAPTAHAHDAGDVASGVLDAARIPGLSAAVITSGTLDNARLNLDASGDCGPGAVCGGGHTHAAYLTAEVDPRVGTANTTDRLCRWDGSAVQCDQIAPSVKTNYVHLGPPALFIAAHAYGLNPTPTGVANVILGPSLSGTFYVPAPVPSGATLTGAWCRVADNDGGRITMSLYNSSTVCSAVDAVSIDDNGSNQDLVVSCNVLVTSNSRGNPLRFTIAPGASSAMLFSCYVSYTKNEL